MYLNGLASSSHLGNLPFKSSKGCLTKSWSAFSGFASCLWMMASVFELIKTCLLIPACHHYPNTSRLQNTTKCILWSICRLAAGRALFEHLPALLPETLCSVLFDHSPRTHLTGNFSVCLNNLTQDSHTLIKTYRS